MPIFVGGPRAKCKCKFFISEMAINQAMLTLYENGLLIKGNRVPSSIVKTFVPNFEEVFGNHSDVFMLLEAVSPPKILITQGISKLTSEASFHLMNPFNEEFSAVYMKL